MQRLTANHSEEDWSQIESFAQAMELKYDFSLKDLYNRALSELSIIFVRLESLSGERLADGPNERKTLMYYSHALFRLMLAILKEADVNDSATWDDADAGGESEDGIDLDSFWARQR